MVGSILFLVVCAIICWLVFSPLLLRIDTAANIYELQFGRIFRSWTELVHDEIWIHFKAPFYHYRANVLDMNFRHSSKKEQKERTKVAKRFQMHRFINIARSFNISKLAIGLDTDDYALNGQLYPIGVLLTARGLPTNINFDGSSYLRLEVRNTLGRLILAYFRLKKY